MDEIRQQLHKTFVKMGIEVDDLDPDLDLTEDLGIESLMRKELAAKLDKKFGCQLSGQIQSLETVGDLLVHLETSGAGAASVASA